MPSPRRRKILATAVVAVLLLSLACLFRVRRFVFPAQLPNVRSIRATGEYQSAPLLARAWTLPVAASYRGAGLVFQPNGSVCGPTSTANVLRSLGVREATARTVLDGSGRCPFGVCFGGLTLDELGELVRTRLPPTHRVTALRDLDYQGFLSHMRRSNDPSRRYIVNFDRGPLFGRAGGHHSPVAGYLVEEDLVLVIDVNAQYRPWLVRSQRLYEATNTVDPSTERKRGILLIESLLPSVAHGDAHRGGLPAR